MLVLFIILFIVSNSFTLRKDISILYSRVSIISLIYIILLAYFAYYINFLSVGIGLYGGLFFINSINKFFHIFICILTIIILIFNSFHSKKIIKDNYLSLNKLVFFKFEFNNTFILDKTSDKHQIPEYPLIIFFIVTGALFLTSSNDLISIFISLELQSYGVYLISSIYKNSESSTAGGLMYFLLGGLSSCLILLGISLIYANMGTTNLDNIYTLYKIINLEMINTNLTRVYELGILNINEFFTNPNVWLDYAMLIIFVGFLFKISAAPFHFWSPDVYDSIPTLVTTFVAIIAKISILILLLELMHNLYKNSPYGFNNSLIISSILSLVIGSILGLNQQRIKKLYAYSTISHIGFILLGLCIHTIESTQAFLFYLIQYSFSNLNAFIILISIGYLYNQAGLASKPSNENNQEQIITNNQNLDTVSNNIHCRAVDLPVSNIAYLNLDYKKKYNKLKNRDTSPIQYIDQLKGYFFINPLLSVSLSITLFSFAGIPPLIGFFGKMTILSSAISKGFIFVSLIAILTSVISASYYLFILKKMFFEKSYLNLFNSYNKNLYSGNTSSNKELEVLKGVVVNVFDPKDINEIKFKSNNIVLSNYISISISILTLIILLFMFIPQELLSITCIFSMLIFNV